MTVLNGAWVAARAFSLDYLDMRHVNVKCDP